MARVRVCGVSEVPPDGAMAVDAAGRRLCVVNIGDAYFVIDDTCTHAEASLAEGYVHADDFCIECPLHSGVFSLRTGEALEFPAEEPVRTYPVTVEGDDLYIDIDD